MAVSISEWIKRTTFHSIWCFCTFCQTGLPSCWLAEDSRAADTQNYSLSMAEHGGDLITTYNTKTTHPRKWKAIKTVPGERGKFLNGSSGMNICYVCVLAAVLKMRKGKISFHKQLQLLLFALVDTPVTTEGMNGQHIKAKKCKSENVKNLFKKNKN